MKRFLLILFISMILPGVYFCNGEANPFDLGIEDYNKDYPEKPTITKDNELDTLNLINYYRTVAGLNSVDIDYDLSLHSSVHLEYVLKKSKLTHDGTEYGDKCLLADKADGMYEAIDLWINSLYHRIPILNKNLERIGFAFKDGYAVLNIKEGIELKNNENENVDDLIVFPPDRINNVPTTFSTNEIPNPIPEDYEIPTGSFITVHFSERAMIHTDLRAWLYDENGNEVEIKSGIVKEWSNVFSIIPRFPLRANSRYSIEIYGIVNEKIMSRQWSFTTSR